MRALSGDRDDDFLCNACHGKGATPPLANKYQFSVDNIAAFRDCVAANGGGFEIW